jgi:UDPglucose 6-dehydrogenase
MINKILIFGAGYVGMSLAILLADKFKVLIFDVDNVKVKKINDKEYPIIDSLLDNFLSTKKLDLKAINSFTEHLSISDLIILALPTNYDEKSNQFDTTILNNTLNTLDKYSFNKPIIIKSTIPIGYTVDVKKIYPNLNIIFVPEFLREGKALKDNLYPSRIVIGGIEEKTREVAEVFNSIAINNPDIFFMSSAEAEAVKLFANTYLAIRISFFNELDSYCLENKIDTKNIINGISSDPRIGNGYNNPSFGYGGYCLPKDTKQLLANYKNIPQELFSAVIKSNIKRKEFIAQKIINKNPKVVGIYRLIMKAGSDNFRESAITDVISNLENHNIKIVIYEPLIKNKNFNNWVVINSLKEFKQSSDIIIANRNDESLSDVAIKVFTRDIFGDN